MHVEWMRATSNPAEFINENVAFSDDFGQSVDLGNVGMYVGDGEGCTIVEGTREEIAAWLRAALELFS